MFGLGRLVPVARRMLVPLARPQVKQVRNMGEHRWYYREINMDLNKSTKIKAEAVATLMWYWILWHMWYDWDHLVGGHEYPDPSKWTDEELGIPPDDED